MAGKPSWSERVSYRLAGIPKGLRSLDRTLMLLATLQRLGWDRSVRLGRPVNVEGDPLPWFSYPAIHFLEGAIQPTDVVFEFGGGGSSLWFAKRVRRVSTVEHDPTWSSKLRALAPANLEIRHEACGGDGILASEGDEYLSALEERVDVIVVDGLARHSCSERAVEYLNTDGLLIVDNTDRPELWPTLEMLRSRRFRRLDFCGPGPGHVNLTCTSVFWTTDSISRFSGAQRPPYFGRHIDDFPRNLLP